MFGDNLNKIQYCSMRQYLKYNKLKPPIPSCTGKTRINKLPQFLTTEGSGCGFYSSNQTTVNTTSKKRRPSMNTRVTSAASSFGMRMNKDSTPKKLKENLQMMRERATTASKQKGTQMRLKSAKVVFDYRPGTAMKAKTFAVPETSVKFLNDVGKSREKWILPVVAKAKKISHDDWLNDYYPKEKPIKSTLLVHPKLHLDISSDFK